MSLIPPDPPRTPPPVSSRKHAREESSITTPDINSRVTRAAGRGMTLPEIEPSDFLRGPERRYTTPVDQMIIEGELPPPAPIRGRGGEVDSPLPPPTGNALFDEE